MFTIKGRLKMKQWVRLWLMSMDMSHHSFGTILWGILMMADFLLWKVPLHPIVQNISKIDISNKIWLLMAQSIIKMRKKITKILSLLKKIKVCIWSVLLGNRLIDHLTRSKELIISHWIAILLDFYMHPDRLFQNEIIIMHQLVKSFMKKNVWRIDKINFLKISHLLLIIKIKLLKNQETSIVFNQ